MNILSHRNNIVLFLACNMAAMQNLHSLAIYPVDNIIHLSFICERTIWCMITTFTQFTPQEKKVIYLLFIYLSIYLFVYLFIIFHLFHSFFVFPLFNSIFCLKEILFL